MNHEVYICYDDKDQITADAICHVLEDNNIKCWFKSRDLGVQDMVDEIMDAINESRLMVLIFSSHSKNSNYVNTEVDMAFSENKPILVFKIDESKLDGGLEFFLSNKHWLDAYPDPEVKFESLIKDTSKLLGKPISNPVVFNKTSKTQKESVKEEKKDKPRRFRNTKENKSKPPSSGSSSKKIPIIIAIVIIALIAVVAGYFLLNNPVGSQTTTIILSDSAYMEVPESPNATSKADKNGVFYYIDEKNGLNVTSCNSNITKKSAVQNVKKSFTDLESSSNKLVENNMVIYEKDGVYSVLVENDQYNDTILIQSTNKKLLVSCLNSINYHNPTDSFKVDDSKDVVNATQETQTAVQQASSSSDYGSSSTSSSSSGSSDSSGSSSSDGGYSDWSSSSSSGGYSDWGSSSSSSSKSSSSSSGGYSDW